MKKVCLIILIATYLVGCSSAKLSPTSEEFGFDLASENNRIAAELMIMEYNNNLESLTLERYLSYLDSNHTPSAEGIVEVIKSADENEFKAEKDNFILGLQFNDSRTIIIDNSSTSFLDFDSTYQQSTNLPSIDEIMANKIIFIKK